MASFWAFVRYTVVLVASGSMCGVRPMGQIAMQFQHSSLTRFECPDILSSELSEVVISRVTLTTSRLSLVEMFAQDCVYQVGLGDLLLVSSPLGPFLVVVRNDDGFVLLRESPRTYFARQGAPVARVAFRDIALLAQGAGSSQTRWSRGALAGFCGQG